MTKGDMYHKKILTRILNEGYKDINPRPRYESDGAPAYTFSVNNELTTYDISNGEFPILTLRPIAWKSAVKEIMWIYQDQSNSLELLKEKYNIDWWSQWESKNVPNTIGQRYGATVKKYGLMDKLLNDIIMNPYGRRHIMNMWQESDLTETDGLMPCCYETIWNVRGTYLDMCMVQRSSDFCTAGSINELQYVALLMMVARHCGYEPGVFSHMNVNIQIYDRHVLQASELLEREPVDCNPCFVLNHMKKDFYSFTIDDFDLIDYPRDIIKEKNPQLEFELGV